MRKLLVIIAILASQFASGEESTSQNKFDFRFMPLGIFYGGIELDLDIAITPKWTLGPQVAYRKQKYSSDPGFTTDYEITAYGFGFRGNWFKNDVFTEGLYIGPAIGYSSVKLNTNDSTGPVSASVSALIVSCVIGYGWFWESFNILLGGGIEMAPGNRKVTITRSNGTSYDVDTKIGGLKGEFSLGWTF